MAYVSARSLQTPAGNFLPSYQLRYLVLGHNLYTERPRAILCPGQDRVAGHDSVRGRADTAFRYHKI